MIRTAILGLVGEQEAVDVANRLGFPILVRPSYVLGGRAMVIAYEEERVSKVLYSLDILQFSHERFDFCLSHRLLIL